MIAKKSSDSRILIVSDHPDNARRLHDLLRTAGVEDAKVTTDMAAAHRIVFDFEPHVAILELEMPATVDFEIIRDLRRLAPCQIRLPIMVITASPVSEVKRAAFAHGANDLVSKPFVPSELLMRVKNLLETRQLHAELSQRNYALDRQLRQYIGDLRSSRLEQLHRLTLAAELRDDDTGHHIQRVGRTSALLAKILGCNDEMVRTIRVGAPLHDVGKIGIPDSILLKRSPLTVDEFRIMTTHTSIGATILSGGDSEPLRIARAIALSHHENWDGSGYPSGLRGPEIPFVGRVVAVADVFDALTHDRPYKEAWPIEKSIAEIHRLRDRKFDPDVVDAFDELHQKGLLTSDESTSEGYEVIRQSRAIAERSMPLVALETEFGRQAQGRSAQLEEVAVRRPSMRRSRN